jgi:hypothetical protein
MSSFAETIAVTLVAVFFLVLGYLVRRETQQSKLLCAESKKTLERAKRALAAAKENLELPSRDAVMEDLAKATTRADLLDRMVGGTLTAVDIKPGEKRGVTVHCVLCKQCSDGSVEIQFRMDMSDKIIEWREGAVM